MIVKNILLGQGRERGSRSSRPPILPRRYKLLAERRIGAVVILGADHRIVGLLLGACAMWCSLFAKLGPTALHEPVVVIGHDARCKDLLRRRYYRQLDGPHDDGEDSAIRRWWSRESSSASCRLAMWSRTAASKR